MYSHWLVLAITVGVGGQNVRVTEEVLKSINSLVLAKGHGKETIGDFKCILDALKSVVVLTKLWCGSPHSYLHCKTPKVVKTPCNGNIAWEKLKFKWDIRGQPCIRLKFEKVIFVTFEPQKT